MKYLWWKIRYAYWMRRETLMPWAHAWSAAQALSNSEWQEMMDDGYTPREAVGEELSAWTY